MCPKCENLTGHENSDWIGDHNSLCPDVIHLREKAARLRAVIGRETFFARNCQLQIDGSVRLYGDFAVEELKAIAKVIGKSVP